MPQAKIQGQFEQLDTFMAMGTAYFDDSGTHKESNSAIAALYIATAKKWRRFSKDWDKAAKKAGFETFHMSEFASGRGVFAHWSEVKRQRVLVKLCSIINEYIDMGAAIGIAKRDYDRIIQGDFRNYCGLTHYTAAIRHCAKIVRFWMNTNRGSSVEYVFDWMNKGKTDIIELMESSMSVSGSPLRGFEFQDKRGVPPLQAVDVLAWSYFQLVQEKTAKRPLGWIPRTALDILTQANLKHKFFNAVELRNWAEGERRALARLPFTSTT